MKKSYLMLERFEIFSNPDCLLSSVMFYEEELSPQNKRE